LLRCQASRVHTAIIELVERPTAWTPKNNDAARLIAELVQVAEEAIVLVGAVFTPERLGKRCIHPIIMHPPGMTGCGGG
jgi:hypothetical protein